MVRCKEWQRSGEEKRQRRGNVVQTWRRGCPLREVGGERGTGVTGNWARGWGGGGGGGGGVGGVGCEGEDDQVIISFPCFCVICLFFLCFCKLLFFIYFFYSYLG